MMADHGDPCSTSEASYCMNGGQCFKIPFMSTLTCVCNESYKGRQCEEDVRSISGADGGEKGLIIAVVIIVLLLVVVVSTLIYIEHRKEREISNPQRAEEDRTEEERDRHEGNINGRQDTCC
ncbi:hypothetical protein UPYG_G00264790 [Umbra pygmaea]|uniref:EGF-like domain-containing protein n=1 Tax=Umbra pygmaea TaxID=75934 RepID=A0ABD0WB81_UMBPY